MVISDTRTASTTLTYTHTAHTNDTHTRNNSSLAVCGTRDENKIR